jgi:Fur family transcriptional regulator, peroxide stress response regulator
MVKCQRSSKQRDLIYSVVTASKSHPSADDVYSAAKAQMPNISLGTVYRNLNLLVSEGKLREVIVQGSHTTRFDGMTEDHEHFICNKCGMILDIEPTITSTDYKRALENTGGGTITSHKLSYYGICSKCSQEQ